MEFTEQQKITLEEAAWGGGYTVRGWISGRLYVYDPNDPAENFTPFAWNPIDSDGDAFRLMINLRKNKIKLDIDNIATTCTVDYPNHIMTYEDYDRDPLESARWAIVRMAASIYLRR